MLLSRITTLTLALVAALIIIPLSLAADNLHSLRVQTTNIDFSLDLEELDAMPQTEFSTSTIWTDEIVHFSGVTLFDLLNNFDIEGTEIEFVAVNDYIATIPFAEITPEAPLIATRMNGATMSVRNKGPFWVVYPYDAAMIYRTEVNFTRSVWQLSALNISD